LCYLIIFFLRKKIENKQIQFFVPRNKMMPIQYFLNITRNEFCIFHNSIPVLTEIYTVMNQMKWSVSDTIFVEADLTGSDFKYYTDTIGYKFITRSIPMFDPEA
jgi:hypothetical protein